MYKWITHMHTHLGGECPHKCRYCYVFSRRFGRPKKYTGEVRLIEEEFRERYGSGKSIFIEHCSDLFADGVAKEYIERILEHCRRYPDNKYVFQTKNPERAFLFRSSFPPKYWMGTTIESNRPYIDITSAPLPDARFKGISKFAGLGVKTFITIEPVLDFDVDVFADEIIKANPWFVNIGADSKGWKLPEPNLSKIKELLNRLRGAKIIVREKNNLHRIFQKGELL